MKLHLLQLLFLFINSIIYSQDFTLQPIEYPTQGVNCIYKDHEGFLWIGSAEGLFRYDGYRYKYFSHHPGDTSSISSNSISCISEDASKNLWIGTTNGLNRFDRKKETFKAFFPTREKGGISANVIKSMLLDSKSNFWVGTRKGLNKLMNDAKDGIRFKTFYPDRIDTLSTSEWSFECLYESSNGDIWGCTWGGGLLYFDPANENFISYKENSPNPDDDDNIFTAITEISNDHLMIGTWNGRILFFDQAKRKYMEDHSFGNLIKNAVNKSNDVNKIITDSRGNYWIAYSEGVIVANPHERSLFTIKSKKENQQLQNTAKSQGNEIFEDEQGIIWIGFRESGLKKYDPDAQILRKWFVPFKPESNRRDYITKIVPAENSTLWIGTWGDGIIHANQDGKIIKRILPSQYTNSKSSDVIRDICKDIRDKLWIATHDGLLCFDPLANKFTTSYNSTANSKLKLNHRSVIELFNDNDGLIWIITQESIHKFDPVREKFSPIDELGDLVNEKAVTIFKDADNDYWFGFDVGLYFYDSKMDTSWLFRSSFNQTNTICGNSIRHIMQDKDKKIWISTPTGLSVYNKREKRFTNLFRSDGLPSNLIQETLEDVNQDKWIPTNKNLTRYDVDDKVFINYGINDGLTGEEHHVFKGENGCIYLSSEKGFYHFHPDSIQPRKKSHPVVLTDFILFGGTTPINEDPLNGESIRFKKRITLSHDQEVFGFRFLVLDYTSNENISYSYKLEGYNNEWVNIGPRTEITFQNLKFGEYKLFLNASRGNQLLSDTPTTLDIKILPPFWLTWYAFVIYGLIILFILFLYRSYTIVNERARTKLQLEQVKAEKAHELDQMKLSFFINVSHELRTPLTLISGPLEQVIQQEKNPEKLNKLEIISRNTQRLLNLIGQLLDIRKLEVNKYHPKIIHGNLKKFCDQLLQSFHAYAEQQNLNFISNLTLTRSNYWFSADTMEKILSNFLINAFKFTPSNGRVLFEIKETIPHQIHDFHERSIINGFHLINNKNAVLDNNKYIEVKISDTGCGMEPDEIFEAFERFQQNSTDRYLIGYGIGLSITKELTNLLHGRIYVHSRKGEGTEFILFYPVNKEAFNIMVDPKEHVDNFISKDYSPLLYLDKGKLNQEVNSSRITLPLNEENDQKKRLLIVDDNSDLLDYMHSILNEEYFLFFAENGQQALEICSKIHFSLIITDIMMPVMDGIQLCAKIKEDINTSHIPVILLTARSGTESELQGLESGADDFISKPFNGNILKQRVKNILDSRKKLWDKLNSSGKIIPEGLHLTKKDSMFLEKVVDFIEINISDTELNQDKICSELGFSRTHLYRKLNSLTNQSVNEFIRNIRLKRAAEILRCGKNIHIAELAYTVGFSEHSYFSKVFRKKFDATPKEYNKKYTKKNTT